VKYNLRCDTWKNSTHELTPDAADFLEICKNLEDLMKVHNFEVDALQFFRVERGTLTSV
jgi:hypothetical protein